ncbi:MAG: segregation/condensation protein A [Hymenobacteraceae bacterium]|nr:segregation/condensation protein A [Hymenobacteraceae bacterium]MDX5395615.1 segregation/condensation protein A [Hymenobacteraceae bacterium]MDX5443995.1 segregation/condensation protein A [Hymenobacteraceae bacterium]MDX5511669.1 segregation/condensation protein A [Hymenobacteraceae bacterium]
MSFEIKLPLFEGPFDLLLFFIERDELDIHDIPIFKITNDFMGYIRQMERLNMEVASDFILTAATLMRIKAKMLLPRLDKDEEGNEIDPRQELVQHLLEYKKYKHAVPDLAQMEEDRLKQEKRGNVDAELQILAKRNRIELDLQDVSLYKLMRVFERMMVRYEAEQAKPKHTVYTYPYTIDQQKSLITEMVRERREVTFTELIREFPDKIGLIFNFLAILDMLQLNLIAIEVGEGYNNFYIREAEGASTQVMEILPN